MKYLLIDAGNTRLKWARAQGARLGRIQSAAWRPGTQLATARRALRGGGTAEAVLVSNVAGGAMRAALRAAARAAGAPTPRFVASSRSASGVRNGYAIPSRLGVDRWLTLLGARRLYPGTAVCVISLGTAITIDLLDQPGRHRGGAIAPGPDLMVRSLLRGTALIGPRARRGKSASSGLFATDTRAAIEAGAAHACRALVQHALGEAMRKLHMRPRLLLTGGGAALVRGIGPARVVPGLLFIGLLALADAGARTGRAQ
jgi:type III pantothenate kinase